MTEQTARRSGLRLQNISKRFGGVQALSKVDFSVQPGEIHCLAGENGSGKSTLIKIVCGVYRPDENSQILFDEIVYPALTPALARQLGVQVIWQDLALFPELSVAENIAFEQNLGSRPRLVRKQRLREVAQGVLERLGFELELDQAVKRLNIAQRQIVAICRALVAKAKIVFMDEPTASLTQAETQALFRVVRRLAQDDIALVFVSHRLGEVLEISERVTVLRDGKLVGSYATREMDHDRLSELMTGHVFERQIHARDVELEPIILETRQLGRAGEYSDVSLTVRRGQVVGITGLLGAGRTELALTLFGLNRPDQGEIMVDGVAVSWRSNAEAIRAGVSYVSEDRLALGLIQQQSIADNIVIPVLDRLLSRIGLLNQHSRIALVSTWIDKLAIKIGQPADAVATLSGGNQQRVVLGKWLATEPKILILDSPTVGVDVGARAGIFEIIRSLARQGMAIILISDEIAEVHANADRVLHMQNGRIVGNFDPRRVAVATLEQAVHG